MLDSKIIFLGTGDDPFVVGKQKRSGGGFIIQIEGYQFVIDPGPGALSSANQFGINLRETTAILVTSNDIYHANDINAIISAMTYDGLDKKGVLISSYNVVNQNNISEPTLKRFYANCVERIILPKSGQRIGIENIEIHSILSKNQDETVIGLKFLTPKFILSYTSDTEYSKEIAEQYKNSDILVLNISSPIGVKTKNNLSADDAIKIISHVKPSLTILTHFGKKFYDSDPLDQVRRIQKETGQQVLLAQDGLALDPGSYSASIKQKTLNLYPANGSNEDKE